MSDALERRIQRLEDLEAIRTVTATYAHLVDTGYQGKVTPDPGALAAVFAPDATWTNAAFGAHAEGVDNIVALLEKSLEPFSFAMHSFTNPRIEVDGDTARATWLLWVAMDMGGGGNQVFQSEDLVYRRIGDGWRIASIDLHFGQFAPVAPASVPGRQRSERGGRAGETRGLGCRRATESSRRAGPRRRAAGAGPARPGRRGPAGRPRDRAPEEPRPR